MTIALDTIRLDKGGHESPDDGLCFAEAVALFAGEPHSDKPTCMSPVLIDVVVQFNDVLPDDKRQRLVPLIPVVVGTSDDGLDDTRKHLALDWLVRTGAPALLDLTPSLEPHAAALRALPPIRSQEAARRAGPVVRAAGVAAAAAAGYAWTDPAGEVMGGTAGELLWAVYAAHPSASFYAADAAVFASIAAGPDDRVPAVDRLQDSAVDLFIRMARPQETP